MVMWMDIYPHFSYPPLPPSPPHPSPLLEYTTMCRCLGSRDVSASMRDAARACVFLRTNGRAYTIHGPFTSLLRCLGLSRSCSTLQSSLEASLLSKFLGVCCCQLQIYVQFPPPLKRSLCINRKPGCLHIIGLKYSMCNVV